MQGFFVISLGSPIRYKERLTHVTTRQSYRIMPRVHILYHFYGYSQITAMRIQKKPQDVQSCGARIAYSELIFYTAN
jgi:hypothetical protein